MSNLTRDRLVLLLCVLVAVMGIEMIYLVYQNRKLQEMLDDPLVHMKTLKPEDTVPTIRAQDVTGQEVALVYGEGQPYTLLTWFSTGCEACRSNFEFWAGLCAKHASPQLRMVGFCAGGLEETRQLLREVSVPYPVISVTDQFLVDTYKGTVVPQTILISPTGQVFKVWPGELLPSQKDQVNQTLAELVTVADKGGDH